MKPYKNLNGPWELCGCSNTDYVGDNDTQKIVTGYIVLVNRFFSCDVSEVRKQLGYLLQKLNIDKSRRCVAKYYS